VEWNRFESKNNPELFKPFWATSIELMGITWRPFAHQPSPFRYLTFRCAPSILMRSFDATDFGAVPGSFHARPEVQFQFGIVIDLWDYLPRSK
jgi:hypothetical protein